MVLREALPSALLLRALRHVVVRVQPSRDLALGFVPADAVRLLNLGAQLLALAIDELQLVVAEPLPPAFHRWPEPLPVVFHLTPIHAAPRLVHRPGCAVSV